MKNYQLISPQELHDLDQECDVIIDVRSKGEHSEKHLKIDHFHIPLDLLNPQSFMKKYGFDNKDTNIYFLCGGGTRATKAADKFLEAGYENLNIIQGGIRAYESLGYDLQRKSIAPQSQEKNPLPNCENRLHIISGSLTLFGTILAILVHPVFLSLPIAMSGLLIFSGLTKGNSTPFLAKFCKKGK